MTTRALMLIVIALLVGLAGSSSALASCGDWLSHAQQSEPKSPVAVGRLAAEDNESSPQKPCHGLYCRKAPTHPATPTTPSINPATPESALPGNASKLRSYTLPDSLTSSPEVRPAKGFPSRIDHPPRA